MNITKNLARTTGKIQQSSIKLIATSLLLVICLDFFRVVGDIMNSWDLPLPMTYGMVIFLSVFCPLILIQYGFRDVPPSWAFIVVFIIAAPISIIVDLTVFSAAPLELVTTPAYLVGIAIVSVLLGTIAAGTALWRTEQKKGMLLITLGTIGYFLQFREILLAFIGLITLFAKF